MRLKIEITKSNGDWYAFVDALRVAASGGTRTEAIQAAKSASLLRLLYGVEKKGRKVYSIEFFVAPMPASARRAEPSPVRRRASNSTRAAS